MRYEIKIEFNKIDELKRVIESSYFENNNGKLIGQKDFIHIDLEDPLYIIFKGLNNLTVRLTNQEMIEGSLRCVVSENEKSIDLYPINNYCIIENKKYSFY